MDNSQHPVAAGTADCGGRVPRSRRLNRIFAGVSWGLGLLVLAPSVWHWTHAGINPVDLINVLIAVIGTALGGLLALGGDGDIILLTGADEGQREMIYKAMTPAFTLAYFGLFGIWVTFQFQPEWRGAAQMAIGVLLLLIVVVYLAGYTWRRYRV